MKNRIVLVIPFVMLFCCNKSGETYQSPNVREVIENSERYKDSRELTIQQDRTVVEKEKEEVVEVKDFRPKDLKPSMFTSKDIMGVWKGDYDDGPNATMAIYDDSLFNVEHMESYGYQLSGDTLTIDFGDWKSVSIVIKAVEDTLILVSENGKTVYTTFED